ncbi:MAG TPA: HEAT repeat domain-containing protein [Pirellulaceae bacterium]|nr:HEAT repeat domain-containing protein [Pirellulaceae bacterium]
MISIVAILCASACAIAAEPADVFLGKSPDQWLADLKSESASQRHLAAWALAQSPPSPVNPLFDAAFYEDAVVRYWAAVGITRIGELVGREKWISSPLGRLLEDKSTTVRLAAAEGLARLWNDPNAYAVLMEALANPQEAVRIQAISSLERLGSKAAPLKDHIAKATANDTSEYVKRISTRLLARP